MLAACTRYWMSKHGKVVYRCMTVHCRRHNHVCCSQSAPYRQSPASSRSESRGPSPHSRTSGLATSFSAMATALSSGMDSSKPSSPVYLFVVAGH